MRTPGWLGRLRRPMAAVAAAALLGAAATGCTSDDDWEDDDVVAYVADEAITEAAVDEVAEALRAELGDEVEREIDLLTEDGDMSEEELAAHAERRRGELDAQVAQARTRVLEMRILTEAAGAYAEAEGLTRPAPQLEQHAYELGLSEENAYVQVVGEFYAVLGMMQATVTPAEPSEDDQREVYDGLVERGLTSAPFEEAQEVLTAELMGQQVAMRDLLREALERAETRVRPDHDLVYQLPVTVGSGEAYLALPLDTAD
ncbi:hypothetical protein JQS43_22615 [Natronosporangium hydrolyticum]|uniref:SurA N-terminal domain-containing protein n=1 Tax=Natronosporangium hydrolyticum TaxID=2811111 RepID=A0A895YA82_9ACTN|nr:hypothetical protein [Natronosporangium hydrolyticum]QSB14271.1 hypothetical protein JQS43_22615 [Natronosporangium hydrolyticum]